MATATQPPPPSKPTPPPPKSVATPIGKRSDKTFIVAGGKQAGPQRVVIFGPGGIGKSELCKNMKDTGVNPLFIDAEGGTKHLDVERIGDDLIQTWEDLRDALHSPVCENYGAIVIDSGTKCEELAKSFVIRTVPHEKGGKIEGIEDYGFGKGWGHIYDAMLLLLGDLDQHIRAGRHVVVICHDCTAKVPNPAGEDWLRYEPRLQNSEKSNMRLKLREWSDYLAFIGYDVAAKDGKAKGSGTRSIFSCEMPTHMAKSRTSIDVLPYSKGDSEFWSQVFGK